MTFPLRSLLGSAAFAAAASFSATAAPAQTSAHPATTTTARPATHTSATSHSATGSACLSYPEVSSKVPAPPAGSACPKALYSVTRHADLTLDYKAPIVSGDYLEDAFQTKPVTITLGYIDTKAGTGELAKKDMFYSVFYTGYLPDGTKFDASADHGTDPLVFPYGKHGVIAGWDTGFEGMRVGGKRRLFIPYQLAYGDKANERIPAKSMLIFDMELVAQSATAPAPKAPPAAALPKPAPSPAGASAPPPASSSTPSSSTAPAPAATTK